MTQTFLKPIALIGLSGTGKSTIGSFLANKLGLDFLDTDTIIETDLNQTISEIFKNYGEMFFRDQETKTLQKIANIKNCFILSTGGGIITNSANLELLLDKFFVVKIYCDLDILHDRIKDDTARPLTQNNSFEKINTLFKQREALYNKAHISIDSSSGDIEKIANNLIQKLIQLNES
jgi:shikimate kinase